MIESSNKRGSIYGVYRFLRNECGWKQLTFGDDLLEESDHLDIPADTAAAETPAFDFFRLWMHYEYDELFDSDVPAVSYTHLLRCRKSLLPERENFNERGRVP